MRSCNRKIFDSSKRVSISKQLQIYYNEYKHCIKKLNTDVILNENIFLMKFINDILSFVERYCEKSNVQHISNFNKLINKIIVNQPSAFIYEKIGKRYKNFLIDEFQDTNLIQYDLIKLILNSNQNLFCVGDDDQSIYAWRGANIENIINFPKEFNSSVVRLTKNYRSNSSILEAAACIISNNKNRLGKDLVSFNKNIPDQKINLNSFYSQEEESLWISDNISKKFQDDNSIGVLVRLTAQMRSIEDKFIKYALPYEIIGGPRFFERKEIKDILIRL